MSRGCHEARVGKAVGTARYGTRRRGSGGIIGGGRGDADFFAKSHEVALGRQGAGNNRESWFSTFLDYFAYVVSSVAGRDQGPRLITGLPFVVGAPVRKERGKVPWTIGKCVRRKVNVPRKS